MQTGRQAGRHKHGICLDENFGLKSLNAKFNKTKASTRTGHLCCAHNQDDHLSVLIPVLLIINVLALNTQCVCVCIPLLFLRLFCTSVGAVYSPFFHFQLHPFDF